MGPSLALEEGRIWIQGGESAWMVWWAGSIAKEWPSMLIWKKLATWLGNLLALFLIEKYEFWSLTSLHLLVSPFLSNLWRQSFSMHHNEHHIFSGIIFFSGRLNESMYEPMFRFWPKIFSNSFPLPFDMVQQVNQKFLGQIQGILFLPLSALGKLQKWAVRSRSLSLLCPEPPEKPSVMTVLNSRWKALPVSGLKSMPHLTRRDKVLRAASQASKSDQHCLLDLPPLLMLDKARS
jgi:hypothetical protein